jgi:putative glutathione S-transferase
VPVQELQRSARRGSLYMHDLYAATDSEATGRVTIPCIWDSVAGKVVNNEVLSLLLSLLAFLVQNYKY